MVRRELCYAMPLLVEPLEELSLLLLLLLPMAVLLLGNSKSRLSELGWWQATLLRRAREQSG
jgi:hypothetical protein